MEFFGVFAFIMVIFYISYPSRTKRLETKVRKLERKLRGESEMSKLINDLVGKKCTIIAGDSFETKQECTIIDADDEWVKIQYVDKKSNLITKLMRIEDIGSVEVQE